jgi:hypothetical protein
MYGTLVVKAHTKKEKEWKYLPEVFQIKTMRGVEEEGKDGVREGALNLRAWS